jgi:hypothetical protein
MFEKEIKFIADFNLNKVKSFGSFITFERLVGSSIHPAVIQYISAELDYLISQDRKKLLLESVFDYSIPEVLIHFQFINQEIKKNKKIAFEDLKKLVIQAVSFNINYLVRPSWSLSKLVFNEDKNKTLEEIKLNLNYVYFYDYIKNIFFSYIAKRKLTALSITEFERILNQIDRELFGASAGPQSEKLIDYSIYSMAEFFNPGNVNKAKLNPAALEMFLKEKNLTNYLFKLKSAIPDGSNEVYDIEELRTIIYSTDLPDRQASLPTPKRTGVEEARVQSLQSEQKEQMEPEEEITNPVIFEDVNLQSSGDAEENNNRENIEEEKVENEIIDEDKFESLIEEVKKLQEETEQEETKQEETEQEETYQAEEEKKNNDTIPSVDEANQFQPPKQQESLDSTDEIIEENILEQKVDASSDIVNEFLEKDKEEIKPDTEKNDELDLFFNIEEETENLLKEFKEIGEDLENNEIEIEKPEDDKNEKSSYDFLAGMHDEDNKKENVELPIEKPEDINLQKESGTLKTGGGSPAYSQRDKRTGRHILNFINENEAGKIISSVFNGDKQDFSDTLDKISECKNYEEATEILKSVFITYRVNPYSRDALALTNSVANYFSRT